MQPGGDAGGFDLSGTWRAAVADEPLRRVSTDRDLDDDAWEAVEVPGHWRSVPAFADTDGPLLYRRRFDATDVPVLHDVDPALQRSWLVLDGVFYTSDVWLDGAYVGDTEGYFFPHGFEVTDQLGSAEEHLLALEVACQPPADRTAKRNLTGVFQHWDLIDQRWNPGGVWRPVRIERSGPVRIRHSRAVCLDATAARATIALRAVLDTAHATTVRLRTTIAGVEDVREQPLASGENRVEWTVTVPEPARWWPWALGEQPLHDLLVEVVLADGAVSDRRHRRMGLRSVRFHDWTLHVNGERLYLKGSNLGPTRFALAEASPALVSGDVTLARDAGLDMLRVHAHVSRPELYDAADEQGVLLWQDMPLQWGYHRSVRRQARRQARELVDLLGHHASVFLWCAHNEPLAVDVAPETVVDPTRRVRLAAHVAAAQLLPTWNKSVLDHSIRTVLEDTDGSRPVVAHSGVWPHLPQLDGTDSHLYFGWYHGAERDLAPTLRRWPRLGRFVTELGAQAVPDDADFLEPDRWPDLDWATAYEAHALQRPFFDRFVPPAAFTTFAAWQEATQRYQAMVIRHQIEALRRIRWRPGGGFAQFCFADGAPAVTWSVLDHERRPKLGFEALRAACRSVLIVADRPPAQVRPGDHLHLEVHAISDARISYSDIVATAQLSWRSLPPGGDRRPAWLPLAEVEQEAPAGRPAEPEGSAMTWRWEGDLPADSCVRIGILHVDVPADCAGELLVVDLWLAGDGVESSNRYVAGVAPAGGVPGPVPTSAASPPTPPT